MIMGPVVAWMTAEPTPRIGIAAPLAPKTEVLIGRKVVKYSHFLR
jgi:hypothetical protein